MPYILLIQRNGFLRALVLAAKELIDCWKKLK